MAPTMAPAHPRESWTNSALRPTAISIGPSNTTPTAINTRTSNTAGPKTLRIAIAKPFFTLVERPSRPAGPRPRLGRTSRSGASAGKPSQSSRWAWGGIPPTADIHAVNAAFNVWLSTCLGIAGEYQESSEKAEKPGHEVTD